MLKKLLNLLIWLIISHAINLDLNLQNQMLKIRFELNGLVEKK